MNYGRAVVLVTCVVLLHAGRPPGHGRRCAGADGRPLDRPGLSLPHGRSAPRAAPALHDDRRAVGRARAAPPRHDGLGGGPAGAGLRGRAVRSGTAAGREPLLRHPSGRDRPRQVEQALGRAAHALSQVQLRRHGPGPLSPLDRAPGRSSSPARARQLHGGHGGVDLRPEVSGLHGPRGADGVLADRDGEPQLDHAAAHHRLDPQRSGMDERQLHEAAPQHAVRLRVLRSRHQRRQPRALRRGADP